MKLKGFLISSATVAALLTTSGMVQAQEAIDLLDKPAPAYLIENFGQGLGAAEANQTRKLPAPALGLIKSFEGWFPNFYNDPAGYCTIGYGHLIALRKCRASDYALFDAPLSESDGAKLLETDTAGARKDVLRLVTGTELSDDQFGALTSFVFNVGAGNFRKSTLLRRLNDTSLDEATRIRLAAREFPRWVRAGGQVYNGLIARRACEKALFEGNLVLAADGSFDRRLCDGLGAAPSVDSLIDIETGETN